MSIVDVDGHGDRQAADRRAVRVDHVPPELESDRQSNAGDFPATIGNVDGNSSDMVSWALT